MGVSVLVLGHSGSGKSTSLRNFDEDEVRVLNVAGKPLPFRRNLLKLDNPTYEDIHLALRSNDSKAYIIDDANYLMAFENFRKAKDKGYDKFTNMAVNFEQLLEDANKAPADVITYFFMHIDYDDTGRAKPKTIGKMLDNQLNIEGMFPIVLMAYKDDTGFHFATQTDGSTPVKAPMEMFPDAVIDNDLKVVDTAIREYWGLAPLSARERGGKNG